MEKKYVDFMDEITPDELYDRLVRYGLFSEKLPPIFDAEDFLKYCKTPARPVFPQQWYPYATFNSMRNINIPRVIGIPTPMAHERVCAVLRDNWQNICHHFRKTTANQQYIVSRIHIRKQKKDDSLFKMNYENWAEDGTPVPDISLGKKYLVKADISKCFPSMYTHAIPWALATKTVAKKNAKDDSIWYNNIDRETQYSTNGETHGLLIGPHSSNVLSEIILCAIDEELSPRWAYIRNIDDFSCYVDSKEDADQFLLELNAALRKYDLSLNHKKTEILALPIGTVEQWVNQIQDRSVYLEKFHPYVDYREVQSYLDFCITLMAKNNDNASILYYAIKILRKHKLSTNAQTYVVKTITSLALIYPYIVPLLDDCVYSIYTIDAFDLKKYLNLIYDRYLKKDYFEAASYALYLASKYNVTINNFDVKIVISSNDCILCLCALIYCRHFGLRKSLDSLNKYARALKAADDFEGNWPFVYECLSIGQVAGVWKELKNGKVSFLRPEFR